MKIEHLAIWVKDLEKMRTFYETYFEAKSNQKYINPHKNFESYFLSFTEGCRLELMTLPLVQDSTHEPHHLYFGLTHFSISLGSKEMVKKLTEKLRADGYAIVGEPRWTGDGYYESIVLDPEGNRLELSI